jgi:hypothetical protein
MRHSVWCAVIGCCIPVLADPLPCIAESPAQQNDAVLVITVTFPSRESGRRDRHRLLPDVDLPENEAPDESRPNIEKVLSGIAVHDDSRRRLTAVFAVPRTGITDISNMSAESLWVTPIIGAASGTTSPADNPSEPERISDHLFAVTDENSNRWYVFRDDQWVVLSRNRNLLESQAASLIELANQTEPTDWPVGRLHVDRFPDAWRQYLGRMSEAIGTGRHPWSRRLDYLLLAEWLRAIALDCTTVSLKAYRADQQPLTLDFRFDALAGSPLARTIEQLRAQQSPFAHLAQDALKHDRWLTVHVSLPRFAVVRQFFQPLDIQYQMMTAKTLRTARLSDNPLENPLYDFDGAVQHAIDATINRGEFNLLLSTESADGGEPEHVAAIAVARDAHEIERTFLAVAAAAAGGPAADELAANVKDVRETAIHSFRSRTSDSEGTQHNEYFAVRDNVIFASSGDEALEWIEHALARTDEHGSDADGAAAPIVISGDAAAIGGLLRRVSGPGTVQRRAAGAWSRGGRFTLSVIPDDDSLVVRFVVDDQLGESLMMVGRESMSAYLGGRQSEQPHSDADARP